MFLVTLLSIDLSSHVAIVFDVNQSRTIIAGNWELSLAVFELHVSWTWNPTIFNIIHWVPGSMEWLSHQPSVWWSNWQCFSNLYCKILCKNCFNICIFFLWLNFNYRPPKVSIIWIKASLNVSSNFIINRSQ